MLFSKNSFWNLVAPKDISIKKRLTVCSWRYMGWPLSLFWKSTTKKLRKNWIESLSWCRWDQTETVKSAFSRNMIGRSWQYLESSLITFSKTELTINLKKEESFDSQTWIFCWKPMNIGNMKTSTKRHFKLWITIELPLLKITHQMKLEKVQKSTILVKAMRW